MTIKTKVAKISAATIIAATGFAIFGTHLEDFSGQTASSSSERIAAYDVSESIASEAEEARIIKAEAVTAKREKVAAENEAKRVEDQAAAEAKAAEDAKVAQVQAQAQEQERIAEVAQAEENARAQTATGPRAQSQAQSQTVAGTPVAKAPVVNSPAPVNTVPQQAPAVAAPAAPVVRANVINVGLAGGQATVDMCAGPVLFTPVAQTISIAEHDGCGGWQRFGNMQQGSIVTLTGMVNGTYQIGGRANIAKGSNTDAIKNSFGGFPPVVFQTCIPGTDRMIITAAYPV